MASKSTKSLDHRLLDPFPGGREPRFLVGGAQNNGLFGGLVDLVNSFELPLDGPGARGPGTPAGSARP